MKTRSSITGVSTVIKHYEILDVIACANPAVGISLSDLSKNLDVSKSTILRYLQTMERLGVVQRTERDNYSLGWRLLNLASNYLSNLDLQILAEPFMRDLAAKSEETVNIAIPVENWIIYINKVDSPQSIQMMARIGTRMPMYCTALGKSILAYYPNEKVMEILQKEDMRARTEQTITTKESLMANLEEIRLNGFAVDNAENEEGVRCIGAPLFDFNKKVIGAVSISGPANRVIPERVPELGIVVRETARAISQRMGYTG